MKYAVINSNYASTLETNVSGKSATAVFNHYRSIYGQNIEVMTMPEYKKVFGVE
jgi:hypothetical protein